MVSEKSCPWAELCMGDYLASNLPRRKSVTTLFLIFRQLIVSLGIVQNGHINFFWANLGFPWQIELADWMLLLGMLSGQLSLGNPQCTAHTASPQP